MANKIKKLPFPDWLLNTDCIIYIEHEGIGENGEPIREECFKGKCIFNEHSKRIISSNTKDIRYFSQLIVKGDIAPDFNTISSGYIILNKKRLNIISGKRPLNPDGTVYGSFFDVE